MQIFSYYNISMHGLMKKSCQNVQECTKDRDNYEILDKKIIAIVQTGNFLFHFLTVFHLKSKVN